MQRYEATALANPDEHQKMVLVTSKLCRYQVLFDEIEDQVTLLGPGVDEHADRDEIEFDSREDAAVYYVLLFENGLWPE